MMASPLVSHLLHCNAILFAYTMFMWCCPSTQVAMHLDRDLTVGADLTDGVVSDGHSALVSSIGASIKHALAVVDRHQELDRETFPRMRHHVQSIRNEIPRRADEVQNFGPLDKHPPSTGQPSPGLNQATYGQEAIDGETNLPRDGALLDGSTVSGEVEGETGAMVLRREELEQGANAERRGRDVMREENKEGSDQDLGDGIVDRAQEERDWGDPQPTICEKCQKSRSEDLLLEYDPDALVQLRIETIKRLILDKLRMERPPQVNVSSINIPAPLSEATFMGKLEEHEGAQDAVRHVGSDELYDNSDDYYGKTTRVIVPAKLDAPPCPLTSNSSSCFEFDISPVVRSKVTMAELWLYWTGEVSSMKNQTLIASQKPGHGWKTSRTMAIHNVPPTQLAGWITLDIKHTVRRWRSHSHHDQIVQMSCPTCESTILPLAVESGYRPFIVIRVTDEEKSRRRRNVNCDANTTDCCRQHFHLRFLDLGWDWVISPRGFDANYCRGSCANFNSPSLRHTSLIQTLRSNVPTVNIPRPCCSPRTTGSLSMIYMDNNGKFYTSDLPQMKVLSCGCS